MTHCSHCLVVAVAAAAVVVAAAAASDVAVAVRTLDHLLVARLYIEDRNSAVLTTCRYRLGGTNACREVSSHYHPPGNQPCIWDTLIDYLTNGLHKYKSKSKIKNCKIPMTSC